LGLAGGLFEQVADLLCKAGWVAGFEHQREDARSPLFAEGSGRGALQRLESDQGCLLGAEALA